VDSGRHESIATEVATSSPVSALQDPRELITQLCVERAKLGCAIEQVSTSPPLPSLLTSIESLVDAIDADINALNDLLRLHNSFTGSEDLDTRFR
jgi:hypothetical protein